MKFNKAFRILMNRRKREEIVLELLTYLKAFFSFPKQNIIKFVIFAQGRSGSTLLVKLLNNHPHIMCDGEILNVKRQRKKFFPLKFVKSKARICKQNAYGFKVKIYQLYKDKSPSQNVDPKKFITDLYRSGWKIIYLKRNNIFRQAISSFVAISRDQYHNRSKRLVLPKLNIDPNKLLRAMKNRERHLRGEAKILKNIPHIKIIYEKDLLHDKKKALNKIFRYLKIPFYPVKTNLKRISKDRLQDYILNYEELKKELSKTEYAKFL
jgi:LPS sulfotransferase NodH